jgi:FKBP-type peptidyl-prolyl cis-trans isomerase
MRSQLLCSILVITIGGCGAPGPWGLPRMWGGNGQSQLALADKKTEDDASASAADDKLNVFAPDTVTTETGLQYVDLRPGTGAQPRPGQMVTVHYTGWLTNGKKFDSSHDRGKPFSFPIGRRKVIAGWDEGVSTMQVGGKRKLVIPSELGYGPRGAGDKIPPDSTLVFEVELLEVK